MRTKYADVIERGRFQGRSFFATEPGDSCGAFEVVGPCGRKLAIIVDDGLEKGPLGGWEHVSVSITGKHPPNWQEMCWVKEHFWEDEETVLQFHPKKSKYVNIHPNVLHLWRNVGLDHPLPPLILV